MHAPHGGGLGNGPEIRCSTTSVLVFGYNTDAQVGETSPEIVQGDAVSRTIGRNELSVLEIGVFFETAVVHLDLSVNDHIPG